MALTGRTLAWLNLAWRFGQHVAVRMPARLLRPGDELRRFLDAVAPEGYVPLQPAERELLPAGMNCVHCGMCAIACPAIRAGGASAWEEAWTFVAGPSRSIDRAALAAHHAPPCAECDTCAAACPTGVPIPRLAALVRRLSAQPLVES
jgi:succinate dehydrogenase/fumarate reductase-like Fe-S protein